MTDLKDDISYMRRLAEQGRSGPILGGTFLAAAGIIFGLTCFAQWAVLTGLLPMTPEHIVDIWLGAGALFAVLWIVLFRRLRARTGLRGGASNVVFGVAWVSSAIGIVVTCCMMAIVATVTGSSAVLELNVPIGFVFYGIAWCAAAMLARRYWMYIASAGSFLTTLLLAALTNDPRQIAVMGVALLLLLSVPGLKMMFDEPR